MTWNDRDAESFFARASKDSPPDETPCKRCGIEISRHIGGRCGRYLWPTSNEKQAGRAEPDDPRRTYPVATPETAQAPLAVEPADLSRLGIPGLLAELKTIRDPERAPVPERTAERDAALRALAARQAAEFRAGIATRRLSLSTVCG